MAKREEPQVKAVDDERKEIEEFGREAYSESARLLRQVGARVILSVGAAILINITKLRYNDNTI